MKAKRIATVIVLFPSLLGAEDTAWRVRSLESFEYPPVAAAARLEGIVELDLDIGTDV